MKRSRLLITAAAAVLAVAVVTAVASGGPFNFGAHKYQSGMCDDKKCSKPGNGWATDVGFGPEKGAVWLTGWNYGYGGLDVDVPGADKAITFGDMTQLQTDYSMTSGNCAGGSPRWQINVLPPGTPINDQTKKTAKNIWVYFGSAPTSGTSACPEAEAHEVNSGNYIGAGGPGDVFARYDNSQLPGSAYGDTYTSTLAKYGAYEIVGIQLVIDSGWSQSTNDSTQQGVFDQVQVNGTTSFRDDGNEGMDTH